MSTIDIKSKIKMKEKVENKQRKFGSTLHYYPAYVIKSNGEEIPALFTEDQLKEAMARASSNPEDLDAGDVSWWSWLVGG